MSNFLPGPSFKTEGLTPMKFQIKDSRIYSRIYNYITVYHKFFQILNSKENKNIKMYVWIRYNC